MNTFDIQTLSTGWKVAGYPAGLSDHTAPVSAGLSFIEASVPGAVHYDLIAANMLENPYRSTRTAFAAAWVAKSDWLYQNTFDLDEEALSARRYFLRINGIDTFGEVWLNGAKIGDTQNNYRHYEFPIDADVLKARDNLLEIRVKAHHRMVKDKLEAAKCLGHGDEAIEGLMGKSLIRRYQRSFFTTSSLLNIGAGVLGIGINRPVELAYYSAARITDWTFRTLAIKNNRADCEILIDAEGGDSVVEAVITNPRTGKMVFTGKGNVKGGRLTFNATIDHPELWWPSGYGSPFLYQLQLNLIHNSICVHQIDKLIGIKTTELVDKLPNGRETFYIRVNGKRIYIRGQNTIPLDYIKVYGSEEEEGRFFRLLENSGTNLIRVWGGGMPAGERFYDACDRMGIMLWAEGFLHSNVYPDYDADFVKEYGLECTEMLTRVRRHASLCLICGGNEQIEGWEEYGWQGHIERFYGEMLFSEVMHGIAGALCPEIPYILNSPHGGGDCISPVSGDTHNWGSYYNAFKDPLLVSETCWSQETYSRPETLEKYMDMNVDDYQGKGWFDRWTEETSRTRIGRLAFSNWHHDDNPSLRRYLHTLELEQARADYNALRLFRLRSPSNSGIIYWSFNKGGPLFQFGCVDYGGYPLMSYYVVSKLYRDVAAGLFRDGGEIYIAVSNESGQTFIGSAELLHYNEDGNVSSNLIDVTIHDGQSKKVYANEDIYPAVADRTKEALFLRLRDKDQNIVYEDILLLCPFSEYIQKPSQITCTLTRIHAERFELSLETDCIIRQVELESNQKILCSENYFPMAPEAPKRIMIEILEYTNKNTPQLEIKILGLDHPINIILA